MLGKKCEMKPFPWLHVQRERQQTGTPPEENNDLDLLWSAVHALYAFI